MSPEPMVSEVDKFFIGALADFDQMSAMWENEMRKQHPEKTDIIDKAKASVEEIKMLRDVAEKFDKADLADPQVRRGMAIACHWLWLVGSERACCENHGDHLMAVTRFLASTVARVR